MVEPGRPQVGIGLFIVKDGKVLLGKRKGAHGSGEFAGPGGHLEHMETIEDCALRELAEEAGPDIKIENVRFLCLTNLRRYAPKHYANIGLTADWVSGDPVVMEPNKNEYWEWFDLDEMPSPLFGAVGNYRDSYFSGRVYFAE